MLVAQMSGSLTGSTKAPSVASAPSPRISPTVPARSPPPTQHHGERRGTGATLDTFTTLHDGSGQKTSTLSADDESDTDEDEDLYVQHPLEPEQYDEEGLRRHLQSHQWTEAGRSIIRDILDDNQLQRKAILPTASHPTLLDDRSHLTHYCIFNGTTP